MKIWDGPLSDAEIAEEVAEFIPPLSHIELGRTLLEQGGAARLPVRLFNAGTKPVEARFAIAVLDPAEREVAAASITVQAPAGAWGEADVPLSGEGLAQDGVYKVRATTASKVAMRLWADFLVVPPIPMEKPGDGVRDPQPNLKLIDEIDCAAALGPDRFASTGKSAVVRSRLRNRRGNRCRLSLRERTGLSRSERRQYDSY